MGILVRLFAHEPLPVAQLATFIRQAMNKLATKPISDPELEPDAHEIAVVRLSYAVVLPLGEALVLAIRKSGQAAPHYAHIFLRALIKGAAPPPLPRASATPTPGVAPDPNPDPDPELLALAAFRASCFSGLAEIGTLIGWGVTKVAVDVADLIVATLRRERAAVDPHRATSDGKSHAVAARRGAAFLALTLIEHCGSMLLREHPRVIHDLYRVLKDIQGRGAGRGRGHGRGQSQGSADGHSTAGATTCGAVDDDGTSRAAAACDHESDGPVKFHASRALGAIDELMFHELQLEPK